MIGTTLGTLRTPSPLEKASSREFLPFAWVDKSLLWYTMTKPSTAINRNRNVSQLCQLGLGNALHLDAAAGMPGDWDIIELISCRRKPGELMLKSFSHQGSFQSRRCRRAGTCSNEDLGPNATNLLFPNPVHPNLSSNQLGTKSC